MRHMFRRALLGIFTTVLLALPAGAENLTDATNAGTENVAIKGYDTVAYFTVGQPTKGNREFAVSWHDTKWHFANAHHRDLFAAKPEQYAPQFEGFCAASLTKGKVKVTNPEAWVIVDGKLYLSSSKEFMRKFQHNTAENIKKAEAAWATSQ